MLINNISPVRNNSFNLNFNAKNIQKETKKPKYDKKKLALTLCALAASGVAGYIIGKRIQTNQQKSIFKNLKNIINDNLGTTKQNSINDSISDKTSDLKDAAIIAASGATVLSAIKHKSTDSTEEQDDKEAIQKNKPEDDLVILGPIDLEMNVTEYSEFDGDLLELLPLRLPYMKKQEIIKNQKGEVIAEKNLIDILEGTYQGRDVIIEHKEISRRNVDFDFFNHYYVIRDKETNELLRIKHVNNKGKIIPFRKNKHPMVYTHKTVTVTKSKDGTTEETTVHKNGIFYSHTTVKRFPDGSKKIVIDYTNNNLLGYKDQKIIHISPDGTKTEETTK